MVRIIVREVVVTDPTGEPLIKHYTVDIESPELETLLSEFSAAVIGAEVVKEEDGDG